MRKISNCKIRDIGMLLALPFLTSCISESFPDSTTPELTPGKGVELNLTFYAGGLSTRTSGHTLQPGDGTKKRIRL